MEGTVIIADDDLSIRTVLSQAVTRAGCRVKATGTLSTLWRWIEEGEGDALILDVVLPDGDSLDVLPALRKKRPEMPVLVMSANNTVLTTIRANDAGAYEYFPKPFDIRQILRVLNKTLSKKFSNNDVPIKEIEFKTAQIGSDLPLVGRSQSMQEVYRIMARLINTDLTVMLLGASGTGKELVARALHDFGKRKEKPFITINLAAMPSDQIEIELFGSSKSVKGNISKGKFDFAQGGTLFLDEVGEMPLSAQTRLLRVLQNNGNSENKKNIERSNDVRIISSTQNDIKILIEKGKFREDLYFRINVIPINLPLLRERSEDIPELSTHFLKQCAKSGLIQKSICSKGMDLLKKQVWRGNVRELNNFIQRLVILSPDEVIEPELIQEQLSLISTKDQDGGSFVDGLSGAVERHLVRYFELHGNSLPPPGLYNRILREIEYPLIALSLNSAKGNQLKASKLLGINRNTLRKKIRELDINVSHKKKMM